MIRLKPTLFSIEYNKIATDEDFTAILPKIYKTISSVPRNSWRLETIQIHNLHYARVYLYVTPSVMILLKMKHGHEYEI